MVHPGKGSNLERLVRRGENSMWTCRMWVLALAAWTLTDLDGDTLPDLVVTQSCIDPLIGDAAWERYEAVCSG